MNSKTKIPGMFSFTAVILLFMIGYYLIAGMDAQLNSISYNQFTTEYRADKIKEISVSADGMTIKGIRTDNTTFTTVAAPERLAQFLNDEGKDAVVERYTPKSDFSVWSLVTPVLLLGGIAFFFIYMNKQNQNMGNSNRNAMNFGKSRAKMANPDTRHVTFQDVAGADEEKYELQEVVDFLKNPKKYLDLGARIPKGILLVGPPGTGKTLLAKAVAGEAGVPFFSISGSDFVEMFVGVGASRVRDMFDQAKKNAPCIIFIDEIDAVGRKRGAGLGGGHDEREQTLNQLLVEMDGFGINEGIIMVAATNRPDILDNALLRPGRFDRQIAVGYPDAKGREEILKVHVKKKPLGEDVNLNTLAKMTSGFTGADLENLTNEAALLSVRANKKFITMKELDEAITRVIAGTEKKSRVVSEHERRLTAYHEAGHAIIGRLLPNMDPVHQISIIPRGMAGGYTMHLPSEDRSYMSKSRLLDMMVSLLGGRVAESLVLKDISTGAKNDIDRVSKIARAMVTEYGMSEKVGTISFGEDQEVFIGRDFSKSKNFSEKMGELIDDEVKSLVDAAYKKAEEILTENLDKLHLLAQKLLEMEKIEADEFEELFTTGKITPKNAAPETESVHGEPKDKPIYKPAREGDYPHEPLTEA
ncbi:ATP-dependent zinc metalloprotease FtsH [Proteiniclasticum sp. BAD-10]|uniref:ATP-dependent zinc metalloprotease FtsH n=1 Tax=Proteiniclasticum sediminis TaxID=2804028 RepID=A0A941HR93_9CLOT|nr:ATP-dependent zinc metalloprotease FtsH [Proteiniclasticum sediminis]MBR0576358.1 ATP-dependent zinc metalloprotease FtsH [Proteiniclasticum sediminis]